MSDTYTVERSIVVQAQARRVYEEVVDFHRWRAWSPWEDVDPDLRREYDGPHAGTGAVYRWSGNRKAGKGSMRITRADEASLVHIDLQFEKPFKARNDTAFTFRPQGADGGETLVTWTMTGKKTFMTKVMGIVMPMDKLIGKDFEKGLDRLRGVAEGARS